MSLYTLAIETSCDETAAAVYDSDKGILSNKIFSQVPMHIEFGGVVPEIASRSHLEKINLIVDHALQTAHVTLDDIAVIGVTHKPGLPGSLLIGTCFAKGIAYAGKKKLIGIDHLEGHVFSACIENDIPFPFLCLTASGGHTALYFVEDYGKFTLVGHTVDDAAGEAFDKIAKLMNLPYPGGPVIEKLANQANFQDYYHYPRSKKQTPNFSFSGLKTAVLYDLVKKNAYDMKTKTFTQPNNDDLIQKVSSSLLVCVGDIFKQKLSLALQHYPQTKAITFVGGVACNKYLRAQLTNWAQKQSLDLFTPSAQFCTDNAGMIAFVANYKAQQKIFSNLDLDILR